jgi:hypothetical protein
LRIGNQKDFASGLLYLGAGLAFAIASSGYRMGTAVRMGPGYFPFWLGVILAVIGAVLLFGAMRASAERTRLTGWHLKGLLWVLLAVVAVGLVLEPLGLALSVVILVIAASLASHEFSWTAALLNAAVLVAISIVIFVYGLGLRLEVLPAFLGR